MKIVDNKDRTASSSSLDIDSLYAEYYAATIEDKRNHARISSDLDSLSRFSITTASAYEIQDKETRANYEKRAAGYNENNQSENSKKAFNQENTEQKAKTNKLANLNYGKSPAASSDDLTITDIRSSYGENSQSFSQKAGSKVPWQSAINLQKSITPEDLKIKNIVSKKNARRLKFLSEGSDNVDVDATNKTINIFTNIANKLKAIHFNSSVLAWNINWIAGLIVTFVPLAIALICFILFITRLGIDVLPSWAFTDQYKVRQLMTQYEYYWDCTNMEVSASVEKHVSTSDNKVIAVPLAYDETKEKWSAEGVEGESFVNWRAVLAVYYAGLHSEKELPNSELPTVPSDKNVVDSLFVSDNPSFFNKVFWTMNCVMPSGNAIVSDSDKIYELTDDDIHSVAFNVCYHPSIEQVKNRLGYNFVQRCLVDMYLSSEYDYYFDELIQNRHISSNQQIVDIAAREVSNDNHGEKYKKWIGYDCQWCNVFVNWCLERSGNGSFMASSGVTTSLSYYTQHPELATIHYVSGFGGSKAQSIKQINPQPGWLIIFDNNPSDTIRTHIGIVESYDAATNTVVTIEGNTRHEQTRPAAGNYVARMHRQGNKGNICCFVELKCPTARLFAVDRYKSTFSARKREGEKTYQEICTATTKLVNNNTAISATLSRCNALVSRANSAAEWQLMYGVLYIPGTTSTSEAPIVLIRNYFGSGLKKEDLKKLNESGIDLAFYFLPNYFSEYCKYYKQILT